MKQAITFLFFATFLTACQNQSTSDSDKSITGSDTIVKSSESILTNKVDSIDKGDSIVSENKLSSGDLELLNSKITFNNNFEPILDATIKNNFAKTIVAFELEINFGPGCDIQTIRRKNKLPTGKILIIHQKLQTNNSCPADVAKVFIGDYVCSDGSKRDPGMLYLERRNAWSKLTSSQKSDPF